MNEMVKHGANEGMENNIAAQNVGGTVEMLAVDEEIKDLDSSIDKLRGSLRTSKITCIALGVVIVVVLIARLLV